MTDKEKKQLEYKQWCLSIYGKLPFKWRRQIISKYYSDIGEIERSKVYHSLWNTYTGHNFNLLHIKYIKEIHAAHQKGMDFLKI